jgi:thiamine-phosphate pyrophosphorylase
MPNYDGGHLMARWAERLEGPRDSLPALFAFTDPVRMPDPVAVARTLPARCGLVLRTFGDPKIEALAFALADIARDRRLTLLVSANPDLARRAGAHGVHWPERFLPTAARVRFGGLQTASAHNAKALRKAQVRMDAVFVSTAFASQSPSAGRPMGPFRLAAHAARSAIPVYALGGINMRSIKRLRKTGISGAAAVTGF